MTKVNPLGGGNQRRPEVVPIDERNTKAVPVVPNSVSIPPVVDKPKIVPPLQYGALLVPLRNTLAQLAAFDSFLDNLSKRFRGSNSELFQLGLDGDGKFLEDINEGEEIFCRARVDLVTSCLGVLKGNNNFREKALLSAIVVGLNEQAFVSSYLLPSLEKRASFENVANNQNFSTQILKDLNQTSLLHLFKLVNFDEIMSVDNLAVSLSELPNQHAMLSALVEVYDEQPEYSFMKDEGHSQKEKVQKLILGVAKKLKEKGKNIPTEPLKRLYRTLEKSEYSDATAELLTSSMDVSTREQFLFEVLNDNSDDSYMARRVRFWAIDDIFKCGSNAPLKLESLILRSNDQFLVNYAVYKLATNDRDVSDVVMKRHEIIVNAITKKIKLNEPSYALAFVVSMIEKDPVFTDIFRQLLLKQYLPARGLEDGFANIDAVKTCKIERNIDGGTTFHFDPTENPVTLIDAFQKIGLSTIIKWTLRENEIISAGKKYTEENVLRLFVYAYKNFHRDMSSLMLAVLADTKSPNDKQYSYLAGLAGQKTSGDDLM